MAIEKADCLTDLSWGDNGKGRVADNLAPNYDIVAGATGGNNSGRTVQFLKEGTNEEVKIALSLLTAAAIHPGKEIVLGMGKVINLECLHHEIVSLRNSIGEDIRDRLYISDRASILLPYHYEAEKKMKSSKEIDTTFKGIGMAYEDSVGRYCPKIADLNNEVLLKSRIDKGVEKWQKITGEKWDVNRIFDETMQYGEGILNNIVEVSTKLQNALNGGKKVLIEGLNGSLLSYIHGINSPNVTSSDPNIGGLLSGLGLNHKNIGKVIGVQKGYMSRVGNGVFPTEMNSITRDTLNTMACEFGTITGRPRRLGWLDIELLKYAIQLNGVDEVVLTKLDPLMMLPTLRIAKKYKNIDGIPSTDKVLENVEIEWIELPGWKKDISNTKYYKDLPDNTKQYIDKVEELLDVKISEVTIGPLRSQRLERNI